MNSLIKLLCSLLVSAWALTVWAGEPPSAPQLRIETGGHTKNTAPSVQRPDAVCFSPNGQRVAVGFEDSLQGSLEDTSWGNGAFTKAVEEGLISITPAGITDFAIAVVR